MANRVPMPHDCPRCGWYIRKWADLEDAIDKALLALGEGEEFAAYKILRALTEGEP